MATLPTLSLISLSLTDANNAPLANTRVSVRSQADGNAVRLYTNPTGGLLSATGDTTTDAGGNLNCYAQSGIQYVIYATSATGARLAMQLVVVAGQVIGSGSGGGITTVAAATDYNANVVTPISAAQTAANNAVTVANAAATAATTAQTTATNAATTAGTASTTATSASTTAGSALTAATSAGTAATNAGNAATAAQTTANTAVTNAASAQTTANTAVTNAAAAQSTANNAQTLALAAATQTALATTNTVVSSKISYAANWNASTNVVTGVSGVTSLSNANPGTQTSFQNTATGTTSVNYLGSITSVALNDIVTWNTISGQWVLIPFAQTLASASDYNSVLATPLANVTTTANAAIPSSTKGVTGGVAVNSDTILISANVVISVGNANAATYNGKILEFSGAFSVTLGAGLPSDFGFGYIPPVTGNASFVSDGTTTLNAATTTITRNATQVTIGGITQRISNRNAYLVV